MASAPKKQPTFVTRRLRVRPFRASDGAALHLLYGDADNLRYWGTDPSPSAQRTQRMMSWHLGYRSVDPQGEQAVGCPCQATGVSSGRRPDPRSLDGRRQVAQRHALRPDRRRGTRIAVSASGEKIPLWSVIGSDGILSLRSHAWRGVSKGGNKRALSHPSRRDLRPLLRVRSCFVASTRKSRSTTIASW